MITYYPTLPANWITSGDRIKWAIMVRGLDDHLTDDTITQNYKSAGDIGGLKLEHGGRPKFPTILVLIFNQISLQTEGFTEVEGPTRSP